MFASAAGLDGTESLDWVELAASFISQIFLLQNQTVKWAEQVIRLHPVPRAAYIAGGLIIIWVHYWGIWPIICVSIFL